MHRWTALVPAVSGDGPPSDWLGEVSRDVLSSPGAPVAGFSLTALAATALFARFGMRSLGGIVGALIGCGVGIWSFWVGSPASAAVGEAGQMASELSPFEVAVPFLLVVLASLSFLLMGSSKRSPVVATRELPASMSVASGPPGSASRRSSRS